MSVEPINKKDTPPSVILNDAIEDLDKIESVVLLVQFKDGAADYDFSAQKTETLCYMKAMLDYEIQARIIMDAFRDELEE